MMVDMYLVSRMDALLRKHPHRSHTDFRERSGYKGQHNYIQRNN